MNQKKMKQTTPLAAFLFLSVYTEVCGRRDKSDFVVRQELERIETGMPA
jgi:hypothetical protein